MQAEANPYRMNSRRKRKLTDNDNRPAENNLEDIREYTQALVERSAILQESLPTIVENENELSVNNENFNPHHDSMDSRKGCAENEPFETTYATVNNVAVRVGKLPGLIQVMH